jgi:ABC-2 type transport system permease protein/oleandomycin transport system permease protein
VNAGRLAAISRKEWIQLRRDPRSMILAFVLPVFMVLFFSYAITWDLEDIPLAVVDHDHTAESRLLVERFTASGYFTVRQTLDRSAEAERLLVQGAVRAALVNLTVMTLMLIVGAMLGFRYQTNLLGLLAAVGVTVLFAYALSWAMAAIGLAVKSPEAAQSAVFLPVFPLVFASSVFLPTATMPSWLRAFADNQPVTVTANALRGLVLGADALPPGRTVAGQVALATAWALGILVVFAPLAVRQYRRISN